MVAEEPADRPHGLAIPDELRERYASCPGYEAVPNDCRCPCEGCKHHCGAHDPYPDDRDTYAETLTAELTRYARTEIDPGTGSDIGDQVAIVMAVRDRTMDRLRMELRQLRMVSRGYCPACGRGDCAPTVEDWEKQRDRAEQAEADVRKWLAFIERGMETHMRFGYRGEDGAIVEPNRCADWCYACKTAAIKCVKDVHTRWITTGGPPLGVSLERWWDARLVELGKALDSRGDT